MARVHPQRAIWDLAHLAGLSTAPDLLLIVSDRASYVLHNLAALDIHDHWRYALAPPENGIYSPLLDDESAEWALYREVAEDVQTQIVEVGRMPIYGIQDAIGTEDVYPVPGAGSFSRLFGPVPDDEMWELQLCQLVVTPGTAGEVYLRLISEWATLVFESWTPVATNTNYIWEGRFILSPGQMVNFAYVNVTAGATLYSRIWFCHLIQ